tara:strand:+ start:2187 stop:3062 length:876 start_codon:yes stop_codon:yes gene_type:complete
MSKQPKKAKQNTRPNFLAVKRKLKKDVAKVSETLAKSCTATATAKKQQEAGRVAIINYIHALDRSLDSAFTKNGSLYQDFPIEDLGTLVNDCFNDIVVNVRKAGHVEYEDLKKRGEVPAYDKNETGKNASKAIRDKKRDLENYLMCVTSKNAKVRKNARAACGEWIPGQTNMAWGARCVIWQAGVEHLIANSDLTVSVGRGGEEVEGVYYRGEVDKSESDGDTVTASFGTGKHAYSLALTLSTVDVSNLYTELGDLLVGVSRLQTQCNAGRREIRDSFIDESLIITVKEAN